MVYNEKDYRCNSIVRNRCCGFCFFPISQKSLNSGNAAATPNTYIPRSIMWYNSRGAVYVRDIEEENLRGLFYKSKNGEEVRLTDFDTSINAEFYQKGRYRLFHRGFCAVLSQNGRQRL